MHFFEKQEKNLTDIEKKLTAMTQRGQRGVSGEIN